MTLRHSLAGAALYRVAILLVGTTLFPLAASGQGITEVIAVTGDVPPDGNGTFLTFSDPVLNNAGQTAFWALLTGTSGGAADDSGIYRGEVFAGILTLIAREKPAGIVLNGLTDLGFPAINSSGQLDFNATLLSPTLGSVDRVYRGSGGGLTAIASEGAAAPDGNGDFLSFTSTPALNTSGQAAFKATLTGTSGGSSDDDGIFLGSGGAVTQVAREKPQIIANSGLNQLGPPALNSSGELAFIATLLSPTLGSVGRVYRGSGGALTTIASEGAPAPDGNGDFSGFVNPALNDSGQAAFFADLTNTSGGTSDNIGIFLANGIDTIQVARKGESLAGSTVTSLFIRNSLGANGDERSGINDDGQVAYNALLDSGDFAIARFTIPDVHWTSPASGSWNSNTNWSDGIKPNSFYATFIDPASDVQVLGPAGVFHAKSLTLGGGGGRATLALQTDSLLGILDGPLTIAADGVLTGSGTVDAALNNQAGGEVRLATGQNVSFTGTANENLGRITLAGGALHFEQVVTNRAGGLVIGNGTLSAAGGLSNLGTMAFSAATNVIGDVTNSAAGLIATAGGTTTFLDDVDNQGEVRTSAGSHTVFFGSLAGGGSYTGTGTVVMESDFTPGTSPAEIDFGGDVVFGPAAALEMEIGGTLAGTQFDMLDIAGDVSLAGTLDVALLGGFAPSLGDMFEIITAGSVVDTFDVELLPDLGGLDWSVIYGATNVVLEVVADVDLDIDGDIDGRDFLLIQRNDPALIPQWETEFGNGPGAVSSPTTAVPEPAGGTLAALALAAWFARKRGKSRFVSHGRVNRIYSD